MSRPVVLPRGTVGQERNIQAVHYAKSDALMFGCVLGGRFQNVGLRLQGSWLGPKARVRRDAPSLGSQGHGEGSGLSPGSGGPDLRVPFALSSRSVESPLQREKRWGYASDTVCDNVHRSELQDGNVGAGAVRLPALLPFFGAA